MPAPTLVGHSSNDVPSGMLVGDIMFLHVGIRVPGTATITVPGGWQPLGQGVAEIGSSDVGGGLWWKIAGASESAPSVAASGATAVEYVVSAYRNTRTRAGVSQVHNTTSTVFSPNPIVETGVYIAFLSSRPTIGGVNPHATDGWSGVYSGNVGTGGVVYLAGGQLLGPGAFFPATFSSLSGVVWTVSLSGRRAGWVMGRVGTP